MEFVCQIIVMLFGPSISRNRASFVPQDSTRCRFGIRILIHNGNLSTYPSPKPTLTLTSHLGQNVGLWDG